MLQLNFSNFPELTTDRLQLRSLKATDAAAIYALRSNEEVMRYLDRPLATSLEDAKALLHKIETALQDNSGITWAICLKGADRVIGTIGFWRIDKENHRGEVGYLLHLNFQHKGYMKEALQTVLAYGFQSLNLHSVEANTNKDNKASQQLLISLGFVQEAHFKENYFYNGVFLDSVIFSLLAPK